MENTHVKNRHFRICTRVINATYNYFFVTNKKKMIA
ncbi:hypothetical protein TNCT_453871, partial [Trichonephila clavata]